MNSLMANTASIRNTWKPARMLGLAACLCASPASAAEAVTPVIYMIGDSTMANKSAENDNPEKGWGQLLPEYFQESVRIDNHAKDGRSSKSFLDEGLWTPVVDAMRPGDWLIIQFGHNDQKKDKPALYADPATTYRENLTRFVNEARAKGANPILATSIYRRTFTEDGKLKPTLGTYPETTRQLAAELNVPLVDLNEFTRVRLEAEGPDKSKALYLHFAPGEHPLFPNGRGDNSHLSTLGARAVAAMFVQSLQAQKIPLATWVKPTASQPESKP